MAGGGRDEGDVGRGAPGGLLRRFGGGARRPPNDGRQGGAASAEFGHPDGVRVAPRGGGGPGGWDDDEWDAGWETGTWDTGWAIPAGSAAPGVSRTSALLAALRTGGPRIGRAEGVRQLLRRRPAAAAMLAFVLLGFALTCCAPAIPLLRLGYDAADAAGRVSTLQGLFAGGAAALFNGAKLEQAKGEVDAITRDLYEINGALNVAGAPLAAVSAQARNYRLLARLGYDLSAAADEGLDVARTLLLPLEGGALSSDASTPGITQADLDQARTVLRDANTRVTDALAAYRQLDTRALPAVLQPSGKYGKYLDLLPTAQSVLGEMSVLLDGAGALLGVGKPANYLVVAMDRSELRPGGGFQGNYGILTLEGGKQSKTDQLGLGDVYPLDQAYFQKIHGTTDIHDCQGPYSPPQLDQPPLFYWWWPIRISASDGVCQFNWGLRDSNLSPDFPSNARTAIQIAEDSGLVPNTGTLQGEIAFTPELIAGLLQPNVLGSVTLPAWGNVTVTPANIEDQIHQHQLELPASANASRKAFTHDLGNALIAKLKGARGDTLKAVLNVVEKGLQTKALQIYLADSNAELALRQLGLASEVNRGGQDGFFVVDANFGGNKGNTFVTESQTDYVELLPDGGALHHLQVGVTYKMTGEVYDKDERQKDYIALQRTYLPGDATILGYSGFAPSIFSFCSAPGDYCQGYASAVSAVGPVYGIKQPNTLSDVPGRQMVMGGIDVMCGHGTSGIQTTEDYTDLPNHFVEANGCQAHVSDPIVHTQEIYLDFYTPHAFAMDAKGHGTYSELVEKQAGTNATLTVYVDASQVRAAEPRTLSFTDGTLGTLALHDAYAQMIAGKKPAHATATLDGNTTVTVTF